MQVSETVVKFEDIFGPFCVLLVVAFWVGIAVYCKVRGRRKLIDTPEQYREVPVDAVPSRFSCEEMGETHHFDKHGRCIDCGAAKH